MGSLFGHCVFTSSLIPQSAGSITKFLTTGIQQTYDNCNRESIALIANCLTHPSTPCHNTGLDNERYELIVKRGDILGTWNSVEGLLFSMHPTIATRYKVLEKLGHGTFGQVFKCYDLNNNREVALKLLKNKKAYTRQGLLEISTLEMLNTYFDSSKERTVEMFDHFMFCNHLCIVFELLGSNLYQFCKTKRDVGLQPSRIQQFSREIVEGIKKCVESGVIHSDLKPENILMTPKGSLKLIDFGSACFENYTLYQYIQSRHYRAPEIVLGMNYTNAIDMWSIGCIIAEMFLGIPLFPADNEYDLVLRYVQLLGMPPVKYIESGQCSEKYFKILKRSNKYRLKESFEYEWENNVRIPKHKNFLYYSSLEDVVLKNKMKLSIGQGENANCIRECLLDLLKRLLVYEPEKRLTPGQVLAHPFFTCPDLSKVTKSQLKSFVPPEREFRYCVYGHAVTCDPDEMMFDAYKTELNINGGLNDAEYYNVFYTLFQSGHIPNITIDNPFKYGSITPQQFTNVFNPILSSHKQIETSTKQLTPRKISIKMIDSSHSTPRLRTTDYSEENNFEMRRNKFIVLHKNTEKMNENRGVETQKPSLIHTHTKPHFKRIVFFFTNHYDLIQHF
ncbi:Serine/threonine protein kinase ppk15 [Entamoeba marina]